MLSSDELVTQNNDSGSVPGKWCKCGGVIPSMRMLSNIVYDVDVHEMFVILIKFSNIKIIS
jgi:hypothetical protein